MVAVRESVALPWDAFLEREADREVIPADKRAAFIKARRDQIEVYRRVEWPQIVQQLRTNYGYIVPDGLEPHWVEPGRAVYWAQAVHRQVVIREDESGKPRRTMEDVYGAWEPTLPLPADNAWQIDHYTGKGFRLRPPSDGVDAQALEAAQPAEVLQPVGQKDSEPREQRKYICDRHPRQRTRVFTSWKMYIRHCRHYLEPPTEQPPPEIVERMGRYAYYCVLHNAGFQTKRMATRHIRAELKKPGRATHPTLEQMQVRQEEES